MRYTTTRVDLLNVDTDQNESTADLRMACSPLPSGGSDERISATTSDVLAAFATMSRRINDLARELKCLGYFDDGEDRPRAA